MKQLLRFLVQGWRGNDITSTGADRELDNSEQPRRPADAPRPVTRFDPDMPLLSAPDRSRPFISFVVVVHAMPEQARRTLHSLGVDYQRGVGREDYEVILVENNSARVLGESAAGDCNADVKYFLREETGSSPVPALNFGIQQARGTHIACMIDGARLLSPGVINYMMTGVQLAGRAVVAVPGYHLGHKLQQDAVADGYDELVEAGLMNTINWPEDGYRLFEIACFSGTCAGGYFKPIGESNCICVPRDLMLEVGGFEARFTETGGGQVNLDFYKRVVELKDTLLVVLPGEGSFHQFHGGVTTGRSPQRRQDIMAAHFAQYREIRGGPYEPPRKRAVYLGAIPDSALKFVHRGAGKVIELNEL